MSITTTTRNALQYLTSTHISVPHCFTTRLGGVSTGSLSSLNLAMHRGDPPENVEANYAILAQALGFDRDKLVLTRQTHSDKIRAVNSRDCLGRDHRNYPECDGLITCEPGVALTVFTADCTPILFWDPVTGAVGAAHAGWRGTAADIAGKTVAAMAAAYGCVPKNLRAAIGPNIGLCHFETDADVPDAMLALLGDAAKPHIRPKGDKFFVDLKAINALLLRRAGVETVDISKACTMCSPHRFWSHRLTHGDRGSQGAIIVCKGGSL